MKRTNKKWIAMFLLPVFLLAGCKPSIPTTTKPPVELDYEHITWQEKGILPISGKNLKDNTFYLEHTKEDGTKEYYSLTEMTSRQNNYYCRSEAESFPTLYLGQGDRIIYHSYGELLQNIYFTRLRDLGYTIGIYGINSLENGRCFLGTGTDHVLPLCTDADFLKDVEAMNILIDEMGELLPEGYTYGFPEEGQKRFTISPDKTQLEFYEGTGRVTVRNLSAYDTTSFDFENPDLSTLRYNHVTKDNLQSGILYGLTKDAVYHVEFYSGTYYNVANMTANLHIYTPCEYFHTNDYNVEQSTIFEVPVLEEMKDGIYTLGLNLNLSLGAFRLIRGAEYSINDNFTKFTFPEGISGLYSKFPPYNKLTVEPIYRDCTASTKVTDYQKPGFYMYNGVMENYSWKYAKGDAEVSYILDSHKEYFSDMRGATFMAVFTTLYGETYLHLFYEGFESSGQHFEAMDGIHLTVFSDTTIIPLLDGTIQLELIPGTNGFLMLNPKWSFSSDPAIPEEEEDIHQRESFIPEGYEGV